MNQLLVYWTGSVALSFIIFILSGCRNRGKYHTNHTNCVIFSGGMLGPFVLVLWLIGLAYIFYA
jgi:hypothetical protein